VVCRKSAEVVIAARQICTQYIGIDRRLVGNIRVPVA
jgi:hypothetical protein